MTGRQGSVPIAEFEAFYRSGVDPYRMRTRWYEQRKRALVLASLRRETYASGLELACGEGALTRALATRVRRLLATEGSHTAHERAKRALRALPGVALAEHLLPADVPPGPYELVVFSEIGYFLDADDLRRVRDSITLELADGGELVAIHWVHPSADYPLDGPRVHDILGRSTALRPVVHHQDEDFVLDVWRKGAHAATALTDT